MYYEILPSNQLDLALFLEADRMRSLEITKDPARIEAVTAAQAQAAAKKYLDAGRLQIVAVGDATSITDILKKKGKIEAYDADGKPLR